MLNQLTIQNFAIAKSLNLTIHQGFSALTGETGAGKSITLDALNLVMGARADNSMLGMHDERAEVSAVFDISKITRAQAWLAEHELDDEQECILRRVISRDGRSRAYINGRPSALSQVQALSQLLISIHGQHAQQQLLERAHQRQLLERFGQLQTQAAQVKMLAHQWHDTNKQMITLQKGNSSIDSQRELLQYQLDELNKLDLQDGELTELELEHKHLSQADELLIDAQTALQHCQNEQEPHDILQLLSNAIQHIEKHNKNITLKESYLLLSQAKINIEEACLNLQNFNQNFQANPERLTEIEARLQKIYELARKHRVQTHQIIEHQQQLQSQLDQLSQNSLKEAQLAQEKVKIREKFIAAANKLSAQRKKAAKKLSESINKQLSILNMPNAIFSVVFENVDNAEPNTYGLESPQFMIATNTQSKPGSLKQIASGGELSRISLAIEIATQNTAQVPTLIFDEVDTGIGGATAEVVGKLMRTLGTDKQVLCITHQAQLAAKAHCHLKVSKVANKKQQSIETSIQALDQAQRIDEISRMIGGISITEATRQHAQELLHMAS